MLKVWGRTDSSNVQALMWCIGEMGLDNERVDAGHRFGVTDTDAFGAMNPNRTVPVLQDGDNPPLWETGAILRYLGNRYGTAPFWPEELLARTEVDRWMEWAKINVAVNFSVPVFWPVVRLAPERRDQTALTSAITALEKKLSIAEARLARQQYLVSDDFTMADIQFAFSLYRYFDIDIKRAELPHLRRYYDDMQARPTYREHVMVSYNALRA